MQLQIYLYNSPNAYLTVYVKYAKGQIIDEQKIKLCLQKNYGDRVQYVLFSEGELDYLNSSLATGDASEIIRETPDSDFEVFVCD